MPKSARAHRPEALGRAGAWACSAEECARHCQRPAQRVVPPAYAALHVQSALQITSEMYECLERTQWQTCVVCWRAWYELPTDCEFSTTQRGPRSQADPWFNMDFQATLTKDAVIEYMTK